MSLINKEKVLNGVGKAVDITNKTADKVEDFVKEKQIDKKIEGLICIIVINPSIL